MIRLVAPKQVFRPVWYATHFERKTKEEIRQVMDPKLREILFERRRTRPYGHSLLQLKCGHVVIRSRPSNGPILWRPQLCEMCTRREQEMNVRYIRSDMKKRRRAKRAARVQRTPVLRIKLRRRT